MTQDITRSTFRKGNHYSSVDMQQGRVQVDADWNEQNDIRSHHEHTFLSDLIGKSGTMQQDDGFEISTFLFKWSDIKTKAEVDALDVKKRIQYLKDTESLRGFLRGNFGLLWISDSLPFTASGDTITITNGDHKATLERANTGATKVLLKVDGGSTVLYEFPSQAGQVSVPNYMIRRGNYYVDGILCENDYDMEASRQPDIDVSDAKFYLFDWPGANGIPAVRDAVAGFVAGMIPSMPDTRAMTVAFDSGNANKLVVSMPASGSPVKATLERAGGKVTLQGPAGAVAAEIIAENNGKVWHVLGNPSLPKKDGKYLAYLDVWDRNVTFLDDAYIREKALGGPDTSTRTRTAWQVKLDLLTEGNDVPDRCDAQSLVNGFSPRPGKLKARAQPTVPPANSCDLYETAGYRGLENHLYRVEVHNGGKPQEATFKWSRDNGVVVSTIKFGAIQNTIELGSRGRDANLDFGPSDWIEIIDDVHEELGIPGTLVQIKTVKGLIVEYDSATIRGHAITRVNFPQNPKARRWDRSGNSDILLSSASDKDADGYILLEDGVQIKIITEAADEGLRTGDYWLIPARANSSESVEWPTMPGNSADPLALPPAGVAHHYAPLAIVQYSGGKYSTKDEWDVRSFFSSVADLVTLHYAGGDGQEALPDNHLAAPLRVVALLGRTPLDKTYLGSKATVKFALAKYPQVPPGSTGGLSLTEDGPLQLSQSVQVVNGIAKCYWTLGEGMVDQQVEATLSDCAGLPALHFNAKQRLSFYYISGDGVEVPPGVSVTLAAGVAIGNTSVSSTDYEVRFEKVPPNAGGNLSSDRDNPANGIASVELKLDGTSEICQVKAELWYRKSAAAQLHKASIQPLYFNVRLQSAVSAANTGILELTVPQKSLPMPLVYGPFEHYLPRLSVPPAVMLGLAIEEKYLAWLNADEIKYLMDFIIKHSKRQTINKWEIRSALYDVLKRLTEEKQLDKKEVDLFLSIYDRLFMQAAISKKEADFFLKIAQKVVTNTSQFLEILKKLVERKRHPSKESRVEYTEDYPSKDDLRFKPVMITPTSFKVHLWIDPKVALKKEMVLLRWWAVPPEEKRPQYGEPISIGFDKAVYDIPLTTRDPVAVVVFAIDPLNTEDSLKATFAISQTGTVPVTVPLELKRNDKLGRYGAVLKITTMRGGGKITTADGKTFQFNGKTQQTMTATYDEEPSISGRALYKILSD
ncbi:hypothetical protein NTE_00493 [Candidatus Nitrososphaera evergladensis SR1]|uniref:Uncharacterized protein n=1 Tax=Candidatus Nitrososphaera evergladensis SR1 TaxID=1459636 RepID=A0A075MTE3_9ARCH|nr:DUF6519 domain-containing protein [Candidatus Nitrososphaera evergladensis]AIF82574.1 hypothetical protein NTE_00493 [Candidatus Nitrososphaera evergladensis SR1]